MYKMQIHEIDITMKKYNKKYKYVNISTYIICEEEQTSSHYAFSSNCYKFVIDNINNNI